MPTRSRRSAPKTAQTEQAPESRPENEAHLEQSKKRIDRGRITGGDPEYDITRNGNSVSKMRVMEPGKEGGRATTWQVTTWRGLADDAAEKLQQGDEVKLMADWEPDEHWEANGRSGDRTHQLTARQIGVYLPDDSLVPLKDFDRNMLTRKPELEVVPDLETGSLADGGMSAAD